MKIKRVKLYINIVYYFSIICMFCYSLIGISSFLALGMVIDASVPYLKNNYALPVGFITTYIIDANICWIIVSTISITYVKRSATKLIPTLFGRYETLYFYFKTRDLK